MSSVVITSGAYDKQLSSRILSRAIFGKEKRNWLYHVFVVHRKIPTGLDDHSAEFHIIRVGAFLKHMGETPDCFDRFQPERYYLSYPRLSLNLFAIIETCNRKVGNSVQSQ